MSLAIEPSTTMTFTVTSVPRAEAARKTLMRLMRMQLEIQKGLSRLAARRAREDNREQQRGGRIWTSRAKVTKLVRVAEGETFTLKVVPQIVPDLKSVEKYLSATTG
jgi:hypothetical protein